MAKKKEVKLPGPPDMYAVSTDGKIHHFSKYSSTNGVYCYSFDRLCNSITNVLRINKNRFYKHRQVVVYKTGTKDNLNEVLEKLIEIVASRFLSGTRPELHGDSFRWWMTFKSKNINDIVVSFYLEGACDDDSISSYRRPMRRLKKQLWDKLGINIKQDYDNGFFAFRTEEDFNLAVLSGLVDTQFFDCLNIANYIEHLKPHKEYLSKHLSIASYEDFKE